MDILKLLTLKRLTIEEIKDIPMKMKDNQKIVLQIKRKNPSKIGYYSDFIYFYKIENNLFRKVYDTDRIFITTDYCHSCGLVYKNEHDCTIKDLVSIQDVRDILISEYLSDSRNQIRLMTISSDDGYSVTEQVANTSMEVITYHLMIIPYAVVGGFVLLIILDLIDYIFF